MLVYKMKRAFEISKNKVNIIKVIKWIKFGAHNIRVLYKFLRQCKALSVCEKTSILKRIGILKAIIANFELKDLKHFLEDAKSMVVSRLNNILKRHANLKVNVNLAAKFKALLNK